MKKAFILIFTLLLCLVLTACDPGHYAFDYDELSDKVVSVELINYDNPDQKPFISWVPDHSSDLLPFDCSNSTLLEVLDEDRIPDFLNQLSQADTLYEYYVYNSPKGICMKLSLENGNFIIISCNHEKESFYGYIGEYSPEGEVTDFIGSFSSYYYFEKLVSDFFETDLK